MNTQIRTQSFDRVLSVDPMFEQEQLAQQWAREVWQASQLTNDEAESLRWHLYACNAGRSHRKVVIDHNDRAILQAAHDAGFPDAVMTSENLGTRCMVSGGEVMELDSHIEARYEEMTDADPF